MPPGWLKLGMAQLRVGEINPAERSFSAVLALKTNDPEAYNGLEAGEHSGRLRRAMPPNFLPPPCGFARIAASSAAQS